ncbi:MAG: hypothetical protein RBU21_13535 [FCB group bacterium]|jgi:hypothetical protein|nr:hypothetical protein [FCB group bacterium]
MIFPTYSESAARYALRTLPRLSMDEYAEFIEELLAHADPVKIARQKAIEKQIKTPFSFKPESKGT